MLITISIFILSISFAFALLARKVWQLRMGKMVPGSYEEADWSDLSIESIRTHLTEILKFSIHHFALFILKVWILSSNLVKRADRMIREWLVHVLHRNAHYPAGGKPSRFIKNIRAHKDVVTNAIHKETAE